MLGREAVEGAGERVGEVRLVEDAVLVQRLDQDDVGGRQPRQRLEDGVELPFFRHAAAGTVRASVAISSSTLTGLAM